MIRVGVKVTRAGNRYVVCPTCAMPRGPVIEDALSYTCKACGTELVLTHDIILSDNQHFPPPPAAA